MRDISYGAFRGWKGWFNYFKSYSPSFRQKEIAKNRESKLLLYFTLQRLIRDSCPSFGMRESRRSEFRYYFKEAKLLNTPQDVDYFLNTMNHVKQRLESGQYPPFPRVFPSILSESLKREQIYYRKYVWNINKDDLILEPGQDPVRQPFIEPRQYSSDIIDDERYFKHDKKGIIFSDEETILEDKPKILKKS